MIFLGQMQNYMMRINLSIAIVAMVRENSKSNSSHEMNQPDSLTCKQNRLSSTNMTKEKEGDFGWSPVNQTHNFTCLQNRLNISSTNMTKQEADFDGSLINQPDNVTCIQGRLNVSSTNTTKDKEGDFDWSPSLQGVVLASFYYGYFTTQIIGGRLAEKYGTKKIYGGGLFLTGLITFALPLAAKLNVNLFIGLRVLQGIFEGVTFPSLHAITARWIPSEQRNSFCARSYLGTTFGTLFTFPLCSMVIDAFGWEASFYVVGCITSVWFILWCLLVFDTPESHPRISVEEKEYITQSLSESVDSKQSFPVPWRSIFTSAPFIGLLVSEFGNSWGLTTLIGYTPTYMKSVQGVDIKTNGLLSGLPFGMRYVGAVLLSSIADFILKRGLMTTTNVRRLFNTFAMVGPAIALCMIAFVPYSLQCNTIYITTLLCAGQFFNGAICASLLLSYIDLSPNFAATLLGIGNTTSSIISAIVPMVIGLVLENDSLNLLEQWRIIFIVPSIMYVLNNLTYVVFVTGEVQPWNSKYRNYMISMNSLPNTPKMGNKSNPKSLQDC